MRKQKLVVRLTAAERRAINALAAIEKLPPSTLARRLLLQEIDRRGLWHLAEMREGATNV